MYRGLPAHSVMLLSPSNTFFVFGDGASWSTVSHSSTSGIKDFIYANNLFVAVGHSGNILTSNNDRASYTLNNTGASSFMNIVFGKGFFVATGYDGVNIRTSSDNGSTWSALSSSTSLSGTSIERLGGGYK